MTRTWADINVDLQAIGPELVASLGNRGYAKWGTDLLHEIRGNLRSCENEYIKTKVEKVPLGPASSKGPGAALVLGGLVIAVYAGAGHSVSLEQASEILQAIWNALKKLLPKSTRVRVKSGDTTIEVSTDSEEAARSLLRAGIEVVTSLEPSSYKQHVERKRAVAFSPKKR